MAVPFVSTLLEILKSRQWLHWFRLCNFCLHAGIQQLNEESQFLSTVNVISSIM